MSQVTKGLVFAYMLEGVAIGFLVSTISLTGSIVNDNIDEENTKSRRIALWFFTLIAAVTSHVVAESLRHDRILGLLKNVGSKLSFKRGSGTAPLSPRNNLFRKRSILQPTIQVKPRL